MKRERGGQAVWLRAGDARSRYLARRLGVSLREGRSAAALSQAELAIRCGTSQSLVSRCERGLGASSGLETWAVLAAAVGSQLSAFLEATPGADRPRDHEHLRRQDAVIAQARPGAWRAATELLVDPGPRSRSIDVVLTRSRTKEAIVVEVWDWLDDVGAAMRGLGGKTAALPGRLGEGWRVRGLLVLRDTHRNRANLREFRNVLAAHFRGGSRSGIRALQDGGTPMPGADGLVWSAGSRLRAARLLSSKA